METIKKLTIEDRLDVLEKRLDKLEELMALQNNINKGTRDYLRLFLPETRKNLTNELTIL